MQVVRGVVKFGVLSTVIVLVGCSGYQLDKPAQLNYGLNYYPWSKIATSENVSESPNQTGTFIVEPGMTLKWTSTTMTPFDPDDLSHRKNSRFPVVSSGQWVRPDVQERFSRNDYLFASFVLSAGITSRSLTHKENLGMAMHGKMKSVFDQGLCEDGADGPCISYQDFHNAVGRESLARVFHQVHLDVPTRKRGMVEHIKGAGQAQTAVLADLYLCSSVHSDLVSSQGDFPPSDPALLTAPRKLEVVTKGLWGKGEKTMTLSLWDWSDWYFDTWQNAGLPNTSTPGNKKTLDQRPYAKRDYIWSYPVDVEVMVRARVEGQVESIERAPCWSVERLQNSLGREVVAVRRAMNYWPKEFKDKRLGDVVLTNPNDEIYLDPPQKSDFKAADGYFTINFDNTLNAHGAPNWFNVDPNLKNSILIGHGDVFVLGPPLPERATDNPALR